MKLASCRYDLITSNACYNPFSPTMTNAYKEAILSTIKDRIQNQQNENV